MGGKAVPQGVNADAFGNAGTPCCQANDPVELARTRMLPPVARKQPVLTGRHPSLLARDAPPFAQYLEQVGRENDIPILLALALFDPDDHPVTEPHRVCRRLVFLSHAAIGSVSSSA